MNLEEHKHLVWEYEQVLLELSSLRNVRPTDEWSATTLGAFHIPLPADYSQTLLREYVWEVEKKAKDMAAALGVSFEERA